MMESREGGVSPEAARGFAQELAEGWEALRRAPRGVLLLVALLVALYAPVVAEAAKIWVKDENQAHGVFIFPISLFLLWMLRREIRAAKPQPTTLGVWLLGFGLLIQTASWVLGIKWFPMLSLIPVIAGTVLALHGKNLWKVVAFPVCFLFFAAPMPDIIILPLSTEVQNQSTTGSVILMSSLGYPLIQTGNRIDTPTISVEVAEVCSGFKKLTALVAFAFLYGYVFNVSLWKRAVLVLAAYPIALLANIIRICALIFIGSAWGQHALEGAHDWAELSVLVISFGLFVLLGRILGCRELRFAL